MADEQERVAQKRRLFDDDAEISLAAAGGGTGCHDRDDIIDVRPPRRAKTAAVVAVGIAGGSQDCRGGPLLQTEWSRVYGEDNRSTAATICPRAEKAAAEGDRSRATGTAAGQHRRRDSSSIDEDALGDPGAATNRRGSSSSDKDARAASARTTGGRAEISEFSQPSDGSPPRQEDLPAAAAPPRRELDPPLSPDDVSKFEEDGFVMLKRAFAPEVAAACREALWKRLRGEGIIRGDPSTWVNKVGLAEIYGTSSSSKKRRGPPWKNALSPRLMAAVEQLVGADAWEEFGCGWWMVTFPGFAEPPWRAEGKWHCDGAHFRHYPHSREIGLLPIFLFSDVRPHGGGTAVVRGSHKAIAELLWNKAGTTGLTGPQLSAAARQAVLPAAGEDIVETTGAAGDILLTHPLLLHARSTNLAPVEESGVRFMCHPAVPLKRHLELHAPPETFSVVERIAWRARPSRRRISGGHAGANTDADADPDADANADGGALCAIPKPEQCDHSPVNLPPPRAGRWKNGKASKRRRGKKGGQSRGHEGEKPTSPTSPKRRQEDPHPSSGVPANQGSDGAVGPAPKGKEASHPGSSGEQPVKGSDRREAGDCDAAGRRTGEEGAREMALDSGGAAGEVVDAAVMKAMGFGGFGGPRG